MNKQTKNGLAIAVMLDALIKTHGAAEVLYQVAVKVRLDGLGEELDRQFREADRIIGS